MKSEFFFPLERIISWKSLLIPIFPEKIKKKWVSTAHGVLLVCFPDSFPRKYLVHKWTIYQRWLWENFALRYGSVSKRDIRIPAGHGLCLQKNLWSQKLKTLFININLVHILANISSPLFNFPLCFEGALCTNFKTIGDPT